MDKFTCELFARRVVNMTKNDNNEKFKKQRTTLVSSLEEQGYIKDKKVKSAMMKVRREDFVLPEYRESSYRDTPLPIPSEATISAPHMHAISLSALDLKPGDRVLEVGAGSGILLAYMKEIVGMKAEVVGVEIAMEVYRFAKNNLEKSGYDKKVRLVLGDISNVVDKKKFDKIIVSATCPDIPKVLVDNLKIGGILIAPVGQQYGHQELIMVKKAKKGPVVKNLGGVMFVPLRGKYGFE